MPTPTDLVTDLPADFEVFGQAVDSTMADLKGGTTGQMLTKATNTDMDFTWVTPQIGDITAITATSPLTGGGTTGDVTVGIQAASTSQSGAVQLTDSTSSTSTTTAATPNSVKSSYDLANAAIPKSTVTTNGDLIYGTGSGTVSRLGIGSSGQVLSVSGGIPTWTTASGGFTYTTWTPTISGTTVGNGTVTARYAQSGKMVHAYFKLVFGSTSSVSGNTTISLPVTASSNATGTRGTGAILDSGVRWFSAVADLNGTTQVTFTCVGANLSYSFEEYLSSTTPMTWTTNDTMAFSIIYEAA